jgi:hypothetical protein
METATSKKEARLLGLTRYSTGVPCMRGHLAERFAGDGSCVVCRAGRSTQWRKDHPEEMKKIQDKCNNKRRESQRAYRQQPEVKARIQEVNEAWRKVNPGRQREYVKRWREKNQTWYLDYRSKPEVKERLREASRRWYAKNPNRRGEWAKKNPERRRAIQGRRYAKKKLVAVAWADQKKIDAIYAEAERLTRDTGIPHEVDHIYPIQGRTVTGLHHEDNLRVVTRRENRSKGNKFPDEVAA